MGRSEKITKKENTLFHANLTFMWQKLNTGYYQAKQEELSSDLTKDSKKAMLPAYSILANCSNHKDFVPSRSTVDKIVRYYNQHITPETDTYQFLHERLDLSADLRHKKSNVMDERFINTYYCYYPAAANSNAIHGGILKIYRAAGYLQSAFLTGLRDDEAFTADDAMAVFTGKPDVQKYSAYYNAQDKDNRRCSYYEGKVEITDRSLLIDFREPISPFKKMSLTLNIHHYTSQTKKYDGGIGYVLCTSDGSFNTRFFKIGMISKDNGCLSLADTRVLDILSFQEGESDSRKLVLTSAYDRLWYDLILASLKDGNRIIVPDTSSHETSGLRNC